MVKRRGLLLLNLGSPAEPTAAAVRQYLTEFLTDKYVIDLPVILRQFLVRAVIAPRRAPLSAEAYRKIWLKDGSPLAHHTRLFAEKVAGQLGEKWSVRWAFRYGNPSIVDRLRKWDDIDRLDVVPLYPQYAESSTRTAIEGVQRAIGGRNLPFRFLQDFYDRPEFLTAQAECIRQELAEFEPDHILLSFHGLPEHHLRKLHPEHCLRAADCCARIGAHNRLCYRAQCFATAQGVARVLSLRDGDYSVSFQSRLGRRPWIKPYTDHTVVDLAQRGKRRLLVSCPSFVADCLETLEEVQMRLREQFLTEGGQELRLVPALNSRDLWVERFSAMINADDIKWNK